MFAPVLLSLCLAFHAFLVAKYRDYVKNYYKIFLELFILFSLQKQIKALLLLLLAHIYCVYTTEFRVKLPLLVAIFALWLEYYFSPTGRAWFNLGKTKPVKEYRCNELAKYTRRADSSQDFHIMEGLKHVQQENAIISDFEFEVQKRGKDLQRTFFFFL